MSFQHSASSVQVQSEEMLPASMPLALAFSSGRSIAPPRLIRPACRPGAVRLGLGFGMGMGDVAKLPFVQSAWNEIVDAQMVLCSSQT